MCGYKLLFVLLIIIFMAEGRKMPPKRPKPTKMKQKPIIPSAQAKQGDKFPQTITKPISNHIIAGEDASISEIPWQAAIIVKRSTSYFFCGGSLIHDSWILSAGHCTSRSTSYDIRLGSESPYNGGFAIFSNTSYTHPNYNATNLNNDLGLIYLSQPVPLSGKITVIKIIPSFITTFTNLVVSGWGKTSDSATTLAMTLQYAPVSVISNNECKITYGNTVITSNTICTKGNPRQATCQGDSGGPLVMNTTTPYLAGVVSFVASTGCEKALPSGYMRIGNYRSWLYYVTGIYF